MITGDKAIVTPRLGILIWTDAKKASSKVGQEECSQVFVYHCSHLHISFLKNSGNSPRGSLKGLPSVSLRKKLRPREVSDMLMPWAMPRPLACCLLTNMAQSLRRAHPRAGHPSTHRINDGDVQSSGSVFSWALVRFGHRRKNFQLISGRYRWG